MINLEWYRTFKAVYEEGNLTRASKKLFSSQPGVSLHISSLESYVGYKLFERTSRNMIATERAIILYDYISDSLQKLEKSEKHFKKTGTGNRQTISVGMCSEVFQTFFEPNMSHFDFDIIAHFGEYPQMLKELEEGVLDLVITPKKNQNQNISYTPFFHQNIWLVANNETETEKIEADIKNEKWKSLENGLKNQIWYSSSNVTGFIRQFWLLNFNKKHYNKPNYIVPNMNSIIRCLKTSKGIALIPSFLCQKELNNRNIKLIWKNNNQLKDIFYFAKKKNQKTKSETTKIETIITEESLKYNL
ncbi:LysR family transcriptional regulator [Flavivirga jejuensis]|uniref:LysR family transcriptional regulator n=1 Tax=Flavivirga jejuensis TaxID=870487 RepID=A0ABT8WLT7_9FLAO|nr:LysR family transcriptional regulator [Flavivirga jejuensis]MDO5974114.1 LysR family transcriptional regulator [Flavivirga jejuensis]